MLALRSLTVVIALAATAHAGSSRAWTVAKPVLPADLELVAGIGSNVRASSMYPKLVAAVVAKTSSKATLDAITSECKIDLVAAIDSIAIGMKTADKGTIVVALKGSTRNKLEACGATLAAASAKTFAIAAAGPLTKYSGLGPGDLYIRWLGTDAFAISTQPDDKDATLAATKGGLANDKALKAPLASVNTGAGVWGVAKRAADLPLQQVNPKLALIYGAISIVKSNLEIEAHAAFDDAKSATDFGAQVSQQLADQQKTAMGSMVAILKSVAIKASGTQVVITAAPAESDIAPFAAMLGL